MPTHIKIGLSAVVACVGVGAHIFFGSGQRPDLQGVIMFLGPFMIVGMWIFPEVNRRESSGGIKSPTNE